MKKVHIYLICCLLGAATTSATAQTSWQIGSPRAADVTAEYTGGMRGGPLVITGTGAMQSEWAIPPWDNLKSVINAVTIGEGITNIGGSAFSGLAAVRSVTIPNSVRTIGDLAFHSCAITSVVIPNSVVTIGEAAFERNAALASVTLSSSLTTIGNSAFSGCRALRMMTKR